PKVTLRTRTREIVVDEHALAPAEQGIGQIAPNEARPSRDHHDSIASHTHSLLRRDAAEAALPVSESGGSRLASLTMGTAAPKPSPHGVGQPLSAPRFEIESPGDRTPPGPGARRIFPRRRELQVLYHAPPRPRSAAPRTAPWNAPCTRAAPMIEAVMLWNEPNNLSHWDHELDPDWAIFSEMAGLAADAIRAIAPATPLVLGGISPIDPHFLRLLRRHGLLDKLDIIALHGFPLDWNLWHPEEWPDKVREIQDEFRMPVWITES